MKNKLVVAKSNISSLVRRYNNINRGWNRVKLRDEIVIYKGYFRTKLRLVWAMIVDILNLLT